MTTATVTCRSKPLLLSDFRRACGRSVAACPKDCITLGTEIDPASGFIPMVLDLDFSDACGLCFEARPEPYGLLPMRAGSEKTDPDLIDPDELFGPRLKTSLKTSAIPDRRVAIAMPPLQPMVLKGIPSLSAQRERPIDCALLALNEEAFRRGVEAIEHRRRTDP